MRRTVIDVRGVDPRRPNRPPAVSVSAPPVPNLRATPAEHALHKQICRAERGRARGEIPEPR